jgi:hypothetical protein
MMLSGFATHRPDSAELTPAFPSKGEDCPQQNVVVRIKSQKPVFYKPK